MAQCSHDNKLSLVVKKDIEVPNFSRGGRPASMTLKHDGTEPFFNARVYPNGSSADHEGHVSVMVQRCWFYPRFIPGVVYGSVGWTISVVDVEGGERFHAYFGEEDFLSLAWARDLFGEHEFGVERLVKRSVLMDSPEEFLPDDVLTVRVEAFYECHTGDAALATTGLEINAFLVRGFQTQPTDSGGHQSEKQSESVRSAGEPNSVESQWRKSIRMMEESIDELDGAFELYAKFQMLKDITDQNPGDGSNSQQDRDFSQDIGMASAVFMSLRDDAENENRSSESVGKKCSSDTLWYDEPDGVAKITHQVVRILALHKHLQLHFENCRKWYKEAAEKLRAERDSSTGISTRDYTLEDETRELFFLYNEIRDSFGRKVVADQDYLLLRVSRFIVIFLNTLRLMALRLYWPICVLQAPPNSASSCTETTKAVDCDTEPSGVEQDEVSVRNKEEIQGLSTIPETEKASEELSEVHQARAQNEDSVHHNEEVRGLGAIPKAKKVGEELSEVAECGNHKANTNEGEFPDDVKVSDEPDPVGSSSERWYFTIETADGERLEVPFQEGQTTLGSMIRSASPVFDRMLETPMLEKAQRRVKLEDVDYSTLNHFTTYVETGEVTTETLDDCRLLYLMAHKYQVSELLLECGKRMCELMNHLTADEVGEFSKFFGDDTLMSMVEAYSFRPRATMAVMGLQDLNVSPLSPDSTWSQTISQVPVVEKATEAIAPKQDYDFYN